MQEFSEGIEVLRLFLLPFLIGCVASIIRVCKNGWRGFCHLFREAVLCGLYGALVSGIIDLYSLAPTAKYAITCAASYVLVEVGDTIFSKLRELIGKFNPAGIIPGFEGRRHDDR